MIRAAGLLGYAGLLPFAALAIAGAADIGPAHAVAWFAAYSAIILSFLGGIRWGLAAAANEPPVRDLVVSVVLSLWGWAALLLPGEQTVVAVLLAGHALALLADRVAAAPGQPAWLTGLRTRLSVGAIVCHGGLLLASPVG